MFTHADFTQGLGDTTMDLRPVESRQLGERLKMRLQSYAPQKTVSVCDYSPEDFIADITRDYSGCRILVVGAGDMDFRTSQNVDITYSDVALGPLTDVISDAHDLPFEDDSFDAVIAVAVLEHVLDPTRVANEITRVLKLGGHVYANTPFMQQVHMGRYDFVRFSHLGHRRLWRHFEEVRSGVSNGPGVALSWAAEYLARTIFHKGKIETLAVYMVRVLMAPFRWLDRFLVTRSGVFDAASAYYFVGRKLGAPISDREILAQYRGKQ